MAPVSHSKGNPVLCPLLKMHHCVCSARDKNEHTDAFLDRVWMEKEVSFDVYSAETLTELSGVVSARWRCQAFIR